MELLATSLTPITHTDIQTSLFTLGSASLNNTSLSTRLPTNTFQVLEFPIPPMSLDLRGLNNKSRVPFCSLRMNVLQLLALNLKDFIFFPRNGRNVTEHKCSLAHCSSKVNLSTILRSCAERFNSWARIFNKK